MSKRPLDSAELQVPPSKESKLQENGVKTEAEEGAAQQQEQQQPVRREVRHQVVKYRDGEPLPGLLQIYDTMADKMAEVVIPAEYMNNNNRRVKARQIWGDKIYTGDSDIVAVLMHLGYYAHYLAHPPSQVYEFRALLRLLPPQDKYPSKARFVKSRAWCCTIQGCSYQVERCWMMTRSGATIELQPSADDAPAPFSTVHTSSNTQHHTRSAGRKVGQEVTVQFNLCNEPWLKYTLPAIADRGLKANQWTSARFLEEVLLLETSTTRYQLARTGTVEDAAAAAVSGRGFRDVYCLSRCKAALPMGAMRKVGLPLPGDQVEALEEGLRWEELRWGAAALHVRGRELAVKRMHFAPISKLRADGTDA